MILAETGIDPQVIIIFVAMLFAGLKALIEKIQAKKQPPVEEDPDEEYVYDEYEEILRLQREELGLPVVSTPEPSSPPPLPVFEAAPAPPALPKVTKPALSSAEKAALENLNLQSRRTRRSLISTKTRLRQHLSSPTAAREALLLSEIFGKPKSLK